MSETRKVDELIWREDLYPRVKTDPILVQRYAGNLEILPAIEVNQDNIIIDGYHRWTAYRKAEREIIEIIVTHTKSDYEIRSLAIKRNSKHGLQLDEPSKKREAIWLYGAGTGLSKEDIAETLSVTPRTINNYLTDIDKRLREERKQKIRDMWLACYTQTEIAKKADIDQASVSREIETFMQIGSLSKMHKSLAQFMDEDFEIPIYNIWSYAKKSSEIEHFGNSEQRILENLLYLYTEPFDIVLDPFAGGGSTIEMCKKRLRRYWVSDRKPIIEREDEIRKLDIVQNLPPLHNRWGEVTLTYLDPPYWKQAEGKYSEDPEDLANMPLDDFNTALSGVINRIAQKQSYGVIGLLMQPTQWHAPDRKPIDHIIDVVASVNGKRLELENRVSCPYSTQQYNPQQVKWAKENKKLLILTRELIVWRIISD